MPVKRRFLVTRISSADVVVVVVVAVVGWLGGFARTIFTCALEGRSLLWRFQTELYMHVVWVLHLAVRFAYPKDPWIAWNGGKNVAESVSLMHIYAVRLGCFGGRSNAPSCVFATVLRCVGQLCTHNEVSIGVNGTTFTSSGACICFEILVLHSVCFVKGFRVQQNCSSLWYSFCAIETAR